MTQQASPIPSYTRPPIIEAVWSVQFAEMPWLLAPYTGLFWERVRVQYPRCEEQPPLAHVVESPTVFQPRSQAFQMLSAPPLSRQWFISGAGNDVLQLQRDRFCCNWRKVRPADVYPRFQHMRQAFETNWRIFGSFVSEMGQPPPVVDQCELTYINHVPQGDGWHDMGDAGSVFPVVAWDHRPAFLHPPRTLSSDLTFDAGNLRGRLHVSLRHGVRAAEESEPREVLVLELTARGLPHSADLDALMEWFSLARETVVRGFTDLSTSEMHRQWGRER